MPNAARFERFVRELTSLVDAPPPGGESALLDVGRPLLADLLAHDDWLPEAFTRPGEPYYQHYLLHADPRNRFSVVSFVWGPGQKTPVHDHTVWGLVGMLRGGEVSQAYEVGNAGLRPSGAPRRLWPGEVEAVSPTIGDIHQVRNAYSDQRSVSIHVYGADIGRVRRSIYAPSGQATPFISGYSNSPLPDPCGSAPSVET